MTNTKSLSERLRGLPVVIYNSDGSRGEYRPLICTEAADALDQKDAEIMQLRTVRDAALAINEECRDGMSPSLGSLAKLSDALHAEWKMKL